MAVYQVTKKYQKKEKAHFERKVQQKKLHFVIALPYILKMPNIT